MTAPDLTKGSAPAQGAPVLRVNGLNIEFWVDGTWYPAVKDASFDLHPGEVLAIVGESGSGKSTSAMAVMGLLPKNASVTGSILLGDRQLVGASQRMFRSIRGKEVSVIFQEPMTALNPVYTIGFQISEMLRTHKAMSPTMARKRAIELLKLVEIPDPELKVDAYPHALSGGQRQRVMIAQALAMDPKLLIADEPTTALDVTVQAEILKLMRDLKHRIEASIILITHDMGVVADMADRLLVMKDGAIVEHGTSAEIFHDPKQPYTRQLLAAVPHLGSIVAAEIGATTQELAEQVSEVLEVDHHSTTTVDPRNRAGIADGVAPILQLNKVSVEYPKRGKTPAFRAVRDFTLDVGVGEVVGLVGESGSGKTTIGRALVGLLPFVEGTATVVGQNMVNATPASLRPIRRDVSFVFQDPGSSLNPRLPVGESIGEPLLLHKVITNKKERSTRVEELLDAVQLPRAMRNRYPHELSGGQRQRIGIARALALDPKLLIADEPTSALDVSVQARVLDLFQELQQQIGFACLFISHDLAVIEVLCRRIAVLHHGDLVELGTREQILTDPVHDYTKRLLAAVPVPDPGEQRVRREARDQLLAAGIGTDADDGKVF